MKRYQPVTAWQFRRPTGAWVRVCDATLRPCDQLLRGVSARKRDEAQQTAIHEAGHAVAHARLGIDQDAVSIVPNPELHTLGNSLAAGVNDCWSRPTAEDMAVAYCAGYAAVRAAGYPEADAIRGCQDDFEHVDELVAIWALEALDVIKAKALDLMLQPENVAAVARVAKELVDRHTVDGDLLGVLIDVADGGCSEGEFETYLRFRAGR